MINEITEKAKIIFGIFEQKIDVIELDLVSSRTISEKTELTINPVEGGYVNDHIRDLPTEITITGVISKFSIRFRNFGQANLGVITTASSIFSGGSDTRQKNRLQTVYDQLYSIKDKKEPITLKMPRRDYEDMILVGLEFPNDPSDGESLRFTASFRQVIFANSETTNIPNQNISTDAAKKKVNYGRQVAKPANTNIPTQPKTKPEISLWNFIKSPGGRF